jgi:ketosteroid isomerase-like protein
VSEENVELVRRLYEVVDDAGLEEAVIEFRHPDVEVVPALEGPEGSIIRGRDGVREFARRWMTTFEDFQVEPERFVDSGGDMVVVYVRDRGRIQGERCRDRRSPAPRLDADRTQDREMAVVHRRASGPRSRRAIGVVLWTRSRRNSGRHLRRGSRRRLESSE